MTHRTTFALDDQTAQRLRRLSRAWKVSQAEVVRRSLKQAEEAASMSAQNPVEILERLHADGAGLGQEEAASYMAEVRQDRKKWRGK